MDEPGTLTKPSLGPRRSRWRKRLLLGSLLGVPLCLITCIVYVNHFLDRALQEAIAEAERLDPGSRMAELQAKRAPIPDAQDAALVSWPHTHVSRASGDCLDLSLGAEQGNSFWKMEQQVRLDDRQTKALRRNCSEPRKSLWG